MKTQTVEVVVVKSLQDIQKDMSELYEQVRSGAVDLKAACELANIAGKYLKAEQLILMREMFLSRNTRRFLPKLIGRTGG